MLVKPKASSKKSQPCATTLLQDHGYLLENHCCGKTSPSKAVSMSQDGVSAQHSPTLLPSLPLGCSKEGRKKFPPCFERKKRKQLSCGGKDSYYLLFKSGVTSGHRSMRKGNFKAERIWTLEISAQKWCLLVSYAVRGQTHPATPGGLQKGPLSVAEQREAGGPGGA